jgi:hypothetical protein
MVMAGIKKKRVQKLMPKNTCRSACPLKKTFPALYSQVKKPLKPRKMIINNWAMSESK